MSLLGRFKVPTISRNKAIFLVSFSSITGYYAYDRYHSRKIQEAHLKMAKLISDQPMGLTDQPRKLHILISATNSVDGGKYRRSVDKYIKPIFDAAAIDYELYERWEWWKDAREFISDKTKENVNKFISDKKSITPESSKEGVDGWISVGRPAFKALVVGVSDYVLDQVSESDKSEKAKASIQPRRTWGEFLFGWWKKSDKNTQLESDEFEDILTPPIGFVPFQPQRWYKAIFYLFNDRWRYKSMGDAALAIAQGNYVPMSDVFPGSISFDIESSEVMKDQSDEKKDEASNDDEKQEVPESVFVPEEVLLLLYIYQFETKANPNRV